MKPAMKVSALAALVDELGQLEAKAKAEEHNKTKNRIDELRKQLRRTAENLGAEKISRIAGTKYTAIIGACSQVRTVNPVKLAQLITTRALLGLVTVTLTAIEDLAPEVIAAVVEESKTGTRTIQVFEAVQS